MEMGMKRSPEGSAMKSAPRLVLQLSAAQFHGPFAEMDLGDAGLALGLSSAPRSHGLVLAV